MAVGAWQDMFKVVNLEDRPAKGQYNQQVLYSDGTNEIVIKNVLILFSLLTQTRVFYVEGMIWHFEFLTPTKSEGTQFVVYLLELDVLGMSLMCSECGQPKLLLYGRHPTVTTAVQSIQMLATFPLSLGIAIPFKLIIRIPMSSPRYPTG